MHMNPGQHDGSDHRTGHVAVRPDVAKSLAIGPSSTRPVMRRPSVNRTPMIRDSCQHAAMSAFTPDDCSKPTPAKGPAGYPGESRSRESSAALPLMTSRHAVIRELQGTGRRFARKARR